ncbi:MAG: hypothetical protein WC680_07115 [Sulfuricurvum sp.]
MKSAFIRIGRYGLKIILSALSLVGVLYLLAFTPFGNTLLKPLVEKKLHSMFQTPVNIDTFILTHDTLHLHFHDTLTNNMDIQGKFSLITLNLHSFYQANLSKLGGLNALDFPLKTSGALNGSYGMMMAQGSATIFDGSLQYRAKFNHFDLSDLHLSLSSLNYQSLMQWLDYPHNSSTMLAGEIDLHGLDRRDVEGTATLQTRTQTFFPSPIVDDNTSFDFLSLFTDDHGMIQPFRLNLSLNASVDELGILEQFAMLPLRGNADLKAILQGDQDRLVLDARTNLAKSSTYARVHWKRLRPSYVYLNMDHADANALFHIFSLPSPIEGNIHLNAESDITNTTAKLSITHGITHPDIFKQEYALTQPLIHFTTLISLEATPKVIHYRGNFSSDLARLNIDDTTTHESMLRDLLKAIP